MDDECYLHSRYI